MACDSVAVTSANVTVRLSSEDLIAVLRQVLGDRMIRASDSLTYESFYWGTLPAGKHTYGVAYLESGDRVILAQTVGSDGKVTQQMFFDNGSKTESGRGIARLDALKAELTPKLTKALAVGNQTAILKRLSQLGKLSAIQQKDAGVVATLTIQA